MNRNDEALARIGTVVSYAKEQQRTELSISELTWGPLTEIPQSLAELEGLKKLTIGARTIDDLGNISNLRELNRFVLRSVKLRDLSPLRHLEVLSELDISGCSVTNPHSISELQQLKKLSWAGGDLEDADCLSKLSDLSHLNLSGSNIRSLAGLANLRNLRSLFLSHTSVSDLSALRELTSIQNLLLTNTDIKDVSQLAGLRDLRVLVLDRCNVDDLSPLASLTNLQILRFCNTHVSDLSWMREMQKLRSVSMDGTNIRDLTELRSATRIQSLSLKRTKLEKLSGLEDAKSLRSLQLDGSSVRDLSALNGHFRLKELGLRHTQVSSIDALKNLHGLEELDLAETKVVDIKPVEKLYNLRSLNLNNTPVEDLRPAARIRRLTTYSRNGGLQFEGTTAARTDPEIARVSANPKERARARDLFKLLKSWTPTDVDEDNASDGQAVSSPRFAFLSYSHDNHRSIEGFRDFFLSQSIPVWWDNDIRAGANWREEIARHISTSKAVVTFWTEESVRSKSVVEEAAAAQKSGKLIHVRLDNSVLPYGFGETQYVDLREWDGTKNHAQMQKLLQSIRDKLEPPNPSDLSDRLLASSPVALVASNGKLTPVDTPPNVRPEIDNAIDLGERLIGLRQSVSSVVSRTNDRVSYQLPNDLHHSLAAINVALNSDKVSWYGLEDACNSLSDCMSVHYAHEAWNSVLVADLCRIIARVSELKPLLQPKQIPQGENGAKPPELDPVVREDQIAEIGELTSELKKVLESPYAQAVLDDAANDLLDGQISTIENIDNEPEPDRKLSKVRKSLRWLAYAVGGTIMAVGTPVIANLLTAPQAAATLVSRMKPLFDFILKYFL